MPNNSESGCLPAPYESWVEQILGGPISSEDAASCDRCVMCGSEAGSGVDDLLFNPKTKCCTYWPELPNYLVGRALSDNSLRELPRRVLSERILVGAETTPLGLAMPKRYKLLYEHAEDAFGRSDALACPFFEPGQGHCTIWNYRMSTCATWFCKYDRGALGKAFWSKLRGFLATLEFELSIWSAMELGVSPEIVEGLITSRSSVPSSPGLELKHLDDIADSNDPGLVKLWGDWHGKQNEYFVETGRLVSSLFWTDIQKIIGSECRIRKEALILSYKAIVSKEIPARCKVGAFEVLTNSESGIVVTSYNKFDSLVLPKALFEVLHRFDNQDPRQVIEELKKDSGVDIELKLVKLLIDFGILISV